MYLGLDLGTTNIKAQVVDRSGVKTDLSRFSMDVVNLVAVSWTYIVIAEMVNAQGGLGSMIYMATSRGSHVDQLYAVLLLIICIGFVQDKLLKLLDKKLFRFKYA